MIKLLQYTSKCAYLCNKSYYILALCMAEFRERLEISFRKLYNLQINNFQHTYNQIKEALENK